MNRNVPDILGMQFGILGFGRKGYQVEKTAKTLRRMVDGG